MPSVTGRGTIPRIGEAEQYVKRNGSERPPRSRLAGWRGPANGRNASAVWWRFSTWTERGQARRTLFYLFRRDEALHGPESGRILIKILLETGEDIPNFFGPAEVGDGIGNGVVFQREQGAQLLSIQFFDPDPHIM